jgi:hypothetical protein
MTKRDKEQGCNKQQAGKPKVETRCFASSKRRNKGYGSEATIPSVIANAVKQSRRKTPINSSVLDCFVPRNDEKGKGTKNKGATSNRHASHE